MKKLVKFAVFGCFLAMVLTCAACKGGAGGDSGGPPVGKPVPQAPGAPVVIAGNSLLTVYWTAVEGAKSYEVYCSETESPPVQPQSTVVGTTTVLNGLINKTTYYIWIKAVNDNGSSNFSSRSQGIPWSTHEVPAVPEKPVIIPGINQLTVTWEECGGASSYEVYHSTSLTAPYIPSVTSDKTSAVIANLENGTLYYIWVRAVNSAGKSNYSPVEAGIPSLPTAAPNAPAIPILVAGNRELTVSWQAVELAAVYEVWFGTSGDSALAQQYGDDISGGVTETIITDLTNETTYYVWIKAKNIIGTSGFSPPANAKPSVFAVLPETPDTPTIVTGNRELTVSWQAAEGALVYEMWVGMANDPGAAEKDGEDISGTSVILTGLENGATYYIWIKAKNNIGTSDFSPMASGTPSALAATPSTPQSAPAVTAGSGQLAVSWQEAEGALVYEVWAGTTTNPTTATKRSDDVSGMSAVITGLTNGTTYYVWIKAKNAIGTSGFSPMASGTPSAFTVTPQAPSAPTMSIGNGQLTVTWTAVEGALAYEIWLGTTNTSASAAKNEEDESTSLSRTISGLSNGTMYYIWVKAKNNVGTSGFSPVASGIPMATQGDLTLSAANQQIIVTWASVEGASSYQVFYSTSTTIPVTPFDTVTGTSKTFIGLNNGTTYYFWVKAVNASTTSASPMASGKPIGNMGAVTITSGNGRLSLTWSTVAGADQYEVYHSATDTIPETDPQTVMATTVTINGLTNGTTYYVWVKPKNTNGTGDTSTAVSGKPLGTPEAPTIIPAYKQLLVTWTAVPGADEYEVYYGTSAPSTLWTTTATTTATINGLKNGTIYCVRLRVKNANGISDYGPTASNTPSVTSVTPGLYRGVEKIGNHNLGQSASYISANAVTGDDFYVVIGADESVSPISLDFSGKIVGITLIGHGEERTITLNSNGSMFTVNAGVTLTLDENITLRGRGSNNATLVGVSSNGIFTMNGGEISGNTITSSTSYGGGVNVYGIFTMNGGKISGNTASYGGGVCVNGSFTMNDGEISGNTATRNYSSYGGGVYVNGSFIMYGGEISGNRVSSPGANSYYGGGIYLYSGTVFIIAGIVYGTDAPEGLRNTSFYGAALYNEGGTAQYGIFSGSTWISKGDLTTTPATIRVVEGDLQ